MALQILLAAIVALCFTCGDAKKQVSEYFSICHRSDPDLNGCVMRTLEASRPTLVKGIPELKLVPLEPLVIPRLEFSEGAGNFKFRMEVTNLRIHGLSKYTIRSAKLDLDKLVFEMDLLTPAMFFEFDYEIDGKIMLLPIKGNGDGVFNFTDVVTIAHTNLRKVEREGVEYLEVEKLVWDIDASNVKTQLNNLFNGDKTLGKATNDFLNENWREALKTYRHLAGQAFGEVVKDMSNLLYKAYPFKELFPE